MAEYRNQVELKRAHEELSREFEKRWQSKEIEALLNELADLGAEMERADFWDDPDRAREKSMRKNSIERRAVPWRELRSEVIDFIDLIEMTIEESGDSRETITGLSEELASLEQRFDELMMSEALLGEDDGRNCIFTINSGAGGTESQDWAQILMRMYMRYFEKRGYRSEIVDLQDGEEAGIKSATILVRGEMAFGYLKSENGVHRLVRISPFDSNKRRHTSFASVHVTPEIDDDVEVAIDEKDLRVDTYRASGAGGQHINKTDSAIRITHIPTNIVVQSQSERSQHKNRDTAMKMLKARLYELEKQKIMDDIESRSGEKRDVAWGSQIRSYVFHPYKMIKDLRTDHETGNIDAVMDGDLDGFIEAYLKTLATGTIKAGEAVES